METLFRVMKPKSFMSFRIVVFMLFTGLPCIALEPAGEPPLKVGVAPDEPFIMKSGDLHTGFCIDLWQSLAADLGLKFRYVDYPSFAALLEATERGEVDVNANSLYITSERLKRMEFVLPFLQEGMQIMVGENRSSSFMKLWRGLRDSGHLEVFGIGIGVILLGTLLLTVAERFWNKEFHPDWANGFAESFYHVMSITMTGKSSHKPLPGPLGKIMAGIWIAFGVGVVAYITSSITSVMTVNRLHAIINGPQDLPGHRVAAIRGTVAETYCRSNHLDCVAYDSLPEAVKGLLNHDVEAVVHDSLSLQWYDNSHPELPITEVGRIFEKKYCAFALPLGSALRLPLSEALLKRHESGYCEDLRRQYFGIIQ
jgi:ABC-type amino acid transport substrate-binding protein